MAIVPPPLRAGTRDLPHVPALVQYLIGCFADHLRVVDQIDFGECSRGRRLVARAFMPGGSQTETSWYTYCPIYHK